MSAIRVSLVLALLTVASACPVAAQVCLPLIDTQPGQSTGFFRVVPAGNGHWVLTEGAVYFVDKNLQVKPQSLRGERPISPGVLGGTLWLGTLNGALRYDANQNGHQGVSVTFDKPVQQRRGLPASPVEGSLVSVAFGTVLFSRPEGVYRYDTKSDKAVLTALEPGIGYGDQPYWWLSTRGVVSVLNAQLSATEMWTGHVPDVTPVATRTALWLADAEHSLVAIPAVGRVHKVAVPGELHAIVKSPRDEIWVTTSKGLYRIENFAVKPVNLELGNLFQVVVLQDRVLFSRCTAAAKTPSECGNPDVYERPLDAAQMVGNTESEKQVAKSAGNEWVLDATGTTLYVPSDFGLVTWNTAGREAAMAYTRPVRFVNVSPVGTWLGSLLPKQVQKSTEAAPPGQAATKTRPTLQNDFMGLCVLRGDLTQSVSLKRAGLLDVYFEIGSIRVLVGNRLDLEPVLAYTSNARTTTATAGPAMALPVLPMDICSGDACDKGNWQSHIVVPVGGSTFDRKSVSYRIRQLITNDITPGERTVFVIAHSAVLVSGLVALLAGLLVVARWIQWARALIFLFLPKAGWLAYANPAVLLVSFIGPCRWWMLRAVMNGAISAGSPTQTDEIVVAANRAGDTQAASFLVYVCAAGEAELRAESMCHAIAKESRRWPSIGNWRLPVPVRLLDEPGGDLKAAVTRRLQPYALDNDVFVDYLLRSGRMAFVLYETQAVDAKGAAAVAQIVRNQRSHAVCLTSGGTVRAEFGPVRQTIVSDERRRYEEQLDIINPT